MYLQSVCLVLGLVLAVTTGLSVNPRPPNFNYNKDTEDPLGVYNWGSSFPDECAGTKQSPVDIVSTSTTFKPYLPCPGFSFPTPDVAGVLTNTGKTVVFKPANQMALSIFNLPHTTGVYVLSDINIHYGGQSNFDEDGSPGYLYRGSEHLVDGKRYHGEIHKLFRPTSNADDDLLIGIALFVEVVPDAVIENHDFSNFLTQNIPLVPGINDTAAITVDINTFHQPGCTYYTYHGSATTPYCEEMVRWIVYKNPIQVTASAWNKLMLLQSTGGFVSKYGNYRPTQPLNSRIVEFYTLPILL